MLNYIDIGYARDRLIGSIVRANNKAIRIVDMGAVHSNVVFMREEVGGKVKNVDLDITPVPLGYTNAFNLATYLVRAPLRKWKQGCTYNNLKNIGGLNPREIPEIHIAETIEGVYPSFKEAVEKAHHNIQVAFNRNFAIHGNGEIVYKGEYRVATIVNDNYVVNEGCNWIDEALEEAVG